MTTKKFPVSELVLDERCQARADVDHEAVTEYRDAYAAGVALPEPKVFMVSGKAYVVDGYHRVPAAILAKKAWLKCEVVGEGTIEDAVWYAAGVNQAHGVRRTNADKRRAVRLALETPTGAEQSSAALAKHIGVSDKLVTLVREELGDARNSERHDAGDARNSEREDGEDDVRNSERETRVDSLGRRQPAKKSRAVEPEVVDPLEDVPALADDLEDEAPATSKTFGIPNVKERLLAAEAEIKRARLACRRILGEDLNAHAQAIETALSGAEQRLKYAVPETCPECAGEGCKWCGDRGWVTGSQASQMRATAKSIGRTATA